MKTERKEGFKKLFVLMDSNPEKAKAVIVKIYFTNEDQRFLMECQKSFYPDIQNRATQLLQGMKPEFLDYEFLMEQWKSDDFGVRNMSAELLMTHFSERPDLYFLMECQKFSYSKKVHEKSAELLRKLTQEQLDYEFLMEQWKSDDFGVRNMSAKLLRKIKLKLPDREFPKKCQKNPSKLLQKKEALELSADEFVSRYFSQTKTCT